MTKRVHVSSPHDVFIGRPSKWGNPFAIGKHGTRTEVLKQYEEWLRGEEELLKDLQKLKGLVLGCFCTPDQACHGDVIIKILDENPLTEFFDE